MIGFSQDVGYVGRLILAAEGTWGIDGDVTAELEHKLAESLWWVFVLADRLGIDVSAAFSATMIRMDSELTRSIADIAVTPPRREGAPASAAQEEELRSRPDAHTTALHPGALIFGALNCTAA